jgi:uncharacterized RDD family membrane protein YckC
VFDIQITKNMAQSYQLVINGKPEGPFNLAQLKDLNVRPGDFVRTPEMDDYKEAQEVAELRVLFGFNKPFHIPQYFGSFDQRLLASALDWIFVLGFCSIPALIIILFIDDKPARILIAFSLLVLIPLAKLIYHSVMECSAKQATFGKQLLKIKVCDMHGERIGFGQSLWRNLAKIFSVLTVFIGYLFIFFNKQQQGLHDMIAGTLVMKDRLL